ncbi:hypothetical protein EMCRGX_G029731 [Ephydatia muelleri]|eukprot:Em0013g45a
MCATSEQKAVPLPALLQQEEAGKNENPTDKGLPCTLYRRRWLMLATLFLLNLSNGTMWLSYSSVPQYTAHFYGVTLDEVDWFSVIFFVVSVVMGLVTIVILDVVGLRASMYIGAGTNFIGSAIRWLSTADSIVCSHDYQRSGYMVAMIGQTITAFAQPFLLYAPTKLASFWFGPKERAICTTVASIGNPVGLALVQLVTPFIVTGVEGISTMTWIYTIPAALSFVLALVAFWQNKPPTPPSPSTESNPEPFLKGIKQVLMNVSFWVLLLVWGGGAGLFSAVLTLLPQLLCPYGYINTNIGIWGGVMVLSGIIGAALASLLLGQTRMYKEVGVVTLGVAALCFIWFIEVARLEHQSVNIAFSLCTFGFFALPLIPVCMELGVEITYPVGEATSSGLLWTVSQLVGLALVLLAQVLQTPLPFAPNNQCSTSSNPSSSPSSSHTCAANSTSSALEVDTPPQDLTYVGLFYSTFVCVLFATFLFLFWPKYKRLDSEMAAKKATLENDVSGLSHNSTNHCM